MAGRCFGRMLARHPILLCAVAVASVLISTVQVAGSADAASRRSAGAVALKAVSSRQTSGIADGCSNPNSYPAFGKICVAGSSWAPAALVARDPLHLDVFSNGPTEGIVGPTNNWGIEWQCAELAVRWANAAWGDGNLTAWQHAGWSGAAQGMWATGPHLKHPLQQVPNGSTQAPVFGDLLIFHSPAGSTNNPGHVAIVLSVNLSTGMLTFIGENQWRAGAVYQIPISSKNGKYVVSTGSFDNDTITGWLHGPALGTAIQAPGNDTLNVGGDAGVQSVSCGSALNCAAGGYYADNSGDAQAFVASEVNGTWQSEVALSVLNAGGQAEVESVSCGSAGNCAAGGYYSDSSGDILAFVKNQVNGNWQTAIPLSTLNAAGYAVVQSVSCTSAGNCAAGGFYADGSGNQQAFVKNEVNGNWLTASPIAAGYNAGGTAEVQSVSCGSAGNCAAGGYYSDGSGTEQAFVASEVNGAWQTAIPLSVLNTGGNAVVQSVSCASAGNCAAGGFYGDGSGNQQAFVKSEVNGAWQTAIPLSTLNVGGNAAVQSVSCGSAGNCAAGGFYSDSSGDVLAFVKSEVNGAWLTAIPLSTLNAGGNAVVQSVSCGSAGNCAAGGYYTDGSGYEQAFVKSEVSGAWLTAAPVAVGLNVYGNAGLQSVSCKPAGNCGGGGYYTDSSGDQQSFVTSP